NTWVEISGPVTVTFTNANSLTNTVVFTDAGAYVLRLIADDGQVKDYAETTITAILPTQVDIVATTNEAYELGPVPGLFTFTRVGDTNVNLTIFLTFTGTASN